MINDVASEFKKFSVVDWINWVDDILYIGVAYPVSSISIDGDPLIDIIPFLTQNEISSQNYFKALSATINHQIENSQKLEKIERLLTVLTVAKANDAKDILLDVLHRKEYEIPVLPSGNSIKSKSLQAISYLQLDFDEIKAISKYCSIRMKEGYYINDTSFAGNYLFFHQKYFSARDYLERLYDLLLEIDKQHMLIGNSIMAKLVSTIKNNIEEFHEDNESIFYEHFYNFTIEHHHDLFNNSIFLELIAKMSLGKYELFAHDKVASLLHKQDKSYGSALYFICTSLVVIDRLTKINIDELYKAMVFIVEKRGEDAMRQIILTQEDFFKEYLYAFHSSISTSTYISTSTKQVYELDSITYADSKVLNMIKANGNKKNAGNIHGEKTILPTRENLLMALSE